MKIRIAKQRDYRQIAAIHYSARKFLDKGFFSLAPKTFLSRYYKLMLNDPNFITLCVEDENKKIVGFVSASLDAQQQFQYLSRYKFSLGLSLLPSMLTNPYLFSEIVKRYRSVSGKNQERYINLDGARGEFWVWDSKNKNSMWAVKLYQSHLELLLSLGIKKMNFEVDLVNKKIAKFHENNGAKLVENYSLPDGRERLLMCYNLVERKK